MSAWLLAVLAQGVATAPASEASSSTLVTPAAASPRPAECGTARGAAQSLWQRARAPKLARYCDQLARGYARLERAPDQALDAAKQAALTLPEHAAAQVLEGRALLALGRWQEALARLLQAQRRSSQSFEAPGALRDLGVAALLAGQNEAATAAYRSLVPRASLLADDLIRQNVYIEAAAVVMLAGPSALDEAVGYLGEARRRGSPPGTRDILLAALALALDRQGRSEEARGVAAEASGPYLLEAFAAEQREARERSAEGEKQPAKIERNWPVLPPGELDAMVAMLAERGDRELAREHWRFFLATAGGQGPWADHARRRLAAREPARRPRSELR